jgi:hypothetical protein
MEACFLIKKTGVFFRASKSMLFEAPAIYD